MMHLDSAHKAVIGSRFEPTSFDVCERSHNTIWLIWIAEQNGDTICRVQSSVSVWPRICLGSSSTNRGGAGNRWCPLQHILGAFTPLTSFCFRLFPLTNFFSPAVWQIIHFSTGVLPLIPQTSTPSSRSDNCIVSVQSISGGFTHKLRQQGLYLLKTNTGLWYCAYCHLISRCSHPNKFSIWRLGANMAFW